MRQADGRVGRRQHRHVGLVEDRDLELRAARVERAEDAEDAVVAGVGLRVGRAGGRIPLRRGRRRVVLRLELDGVVARRAALLLQVELHGLHERLGLGARSTLHRQVADDLEVAAGRCRRGRARLSRAGRLGGRALDGALGPGGGAPAADETSAAADSADDEFLVVVAAACRNEGDDGDQHERQEPLPPDFHAPPFVVHAPPYAGGSASSPAHGSGRPPGRRSREYTSYAGVCKGDTQAPLQPCISAMLSAPRAWRNGRRGGLKNRWARARVGSTPTARIAAVRGGRGYAVRAVARPSTRRRRLAPSSSPCSGLSSVT